MIVTSGLVVEGLSVERGGRPVLRDLSFRVAPGAALMITGPNGAGKSTLLRAVAGLIPRVAGTVELRLDDSALLLPLREKVAEGRMRGSARSAFGAYPSSPASRDLLPQGEKGSPSHSASPEPFDLAEHTHYLGHGNGLKLALTAAENLRFAQAWSGTPDLTPDQALEAVGLGHVAAFPAGLLSAGQRRRVALARLLVARQPLWLLDEPAAALDAASEALLARLIRDHIEGGGIALAAIHGSLDVPAHILQLGT